MRFARLTLLDAMGFTVDIHISTERRDFAIEAIHRLMDCRVVSVEECFYETDTALSTSLTAASFRESLAFHNAGVVPKK